VELELAHAAAPVALIGCTRITLKQDLKRAVIDKNHTASSSFALTK
jgi:hypothetical protein